MEQSQLVELIKILSPDEKGQVLEFAQVSFFNHGRMKEQVIPFLIFCFQREWSQLDTKLDKKKLFATFFPQQNFVEGKVDKLMVDANKVIRAFLQTQYYFREENNFNQIFDFAEIERLRGLESRHKKNLLRLQKIQEEANCKNASFFKQQFTLDYAFHDYESLYNQKKGHLNIPRTLEALESYYWINRLALLNRFLLQQKIANIERSKLIENLLDLSDISTDLVGDLPVLKINYLIFTILSKPNPEPSDARLLFDHLLLYENIIDAEGLREYYTYLRNICALVLVTRFDNEEMNNTLHELYVDNLARGFLHYEGKLHPSKYLAITENAARVKRYDWALNFITKYKDEIIGENESRDIYRLNLANYYFCVGEFSKCLENIPATSSFIDYQMHGKRLELKSLYETSNDLLYYKLDAFKMFLSRTSQKLFSEHFRLSHTNFANFLTQIISAPPGDHKRAERIIDRLHTKKQTAEWRWLLAKAQELKEKRPSKPAPRAK